MATPSDKLAQSLEALYTLQKQDIIAIRSRDLSRTHRQRLTKNGLQIIVLIPALVMCTSQFFVQYPTDARAVLAMIRDASEILPLLLEGGHSTVTGRLAGAFRNVGKSKIADDLIKTMQSAGYDVREEDPFQSLSIEGYRVSIALIERVRSGSWNPDRDEEDKNHKNALAARGYWQAFQVVRKSLSKVIKGENSGDVGWHDHGDWYRELWGPSVAAGI